MCVYHVVVYCCNVFKVQLFCIEQAIKNFQLEGLIAAVYTPFKDNK